MNIHIGVNVVFEIIGYLGAFLVLVSFLMRDIKWIRIVNIIGALLFIVYGIYTVTWVNVFLNIILIIVHNCFLIKIQKERKNKTI